MAQQILTMKHLFIFYLLCITASSLFGQEILKDINPGDDSGVNFNPTFDTFNDQFYFSGYDGWENALYKSDGTTDGTMILGGESFSSFDEILALPNGALYSQWRSLYFISESVSNESLLFEADSEISNLTRIADTLAIFLSASDTDVTVFRTDGTKNGTYAVGTFATDVNLEAQTSYDKYVVFTESSTQSTKFEPFMTDGSAEGTMTVEDYLSARGIEDDVITARGAEDVLIVDASSENYFIFGDSIIIASWSRELRNSASVLDKRFFSTAFSVYAFDTTDLSLTKLPFSFDFFASLGTSDSLLFYIDDRDKYVYQYNPISESSTKISDHPIGSSNLHGYLRVLNNKVYYWTKGDAFVIRAIDLVTKDDELIDTSYLRSGLIVVPQVLEVNDKIIYTKNTDEYGYEFWVHNPEESTNVLLLQERPLLNVFPNPVENHLTVIFPEAISGKLKIMDISGKEVYSDVLKNVTSSVIQVEHWPTGSYVGSLIQGQNKIGSFRFIK